jgi:hypothetical protein
MRFIKLIFISVIFLSLFLTAFSLLFPPHLHIARNIGIASSEQKINSVISDLHTWDKWNKFINDSSLSNKTISAGGDTLRSDQLQISVKKDSIDNIEIIWTQPNKKTFTGGFKLMEINPGSVTVQWYFDFTFKWYPWEKFSSLIYDKQLQPEIEESLTNLKRLVENNP